jgi:hypothetical protein
MGYVRHTDATRQRQGLLKIIFGGRQQPKRADGA